MHKTPQRQIQDYLVSTIGVEASRRMVSEWRELGVDISNGNVLRRLSEHPELLETMGMLSTLGFLNKILYVKREALK